MSTPAQTAWALQKRCPDNSLEARYIDLLLKAKARGVFVGVRRKAQMFESLTDWDVCALVPEFQIRRADLTLRAVANARERINGQATVIHRVGHRDGHELYAIVPEHESAAHKATERDERDTEETREPLFA